MYYLIIIYNIYIIYNYYIRLCIFENSKKSESPKSESPNRGGGVLSDSVSRLLGARSPRARTSWPFWFGKEITINYTEIICLDSGKKLPLINQKFFCKIRAKNRVRKRRIIAFLFAKVRKK